jgi:hypothetical protein
MEVKVDIPEYVSKEEVQRVCNQLNIRDFTKLKEAEISLKEAAIIQQQIGAEALQVSVEEFQLGLEVELEHGISFPDANVTNNHPLLTGKIVLAHLKETLDYYTRLEVTELEGDLFKALLSGDTEKLAAKYEKYVKARYVLSAQEKSRLSG